LDAQKGLIIHSDPTNARSPATGFPVNPTKLDWQRQMPFRLRWGRGFSASTMNQSHWLTFHNRSSPSPLQFALPYSPKLPRSDNALFFFSRSLDLIADFRRLRRFGG
jgi:hypothetical protein